MPRPSRALLILLSILLIGYGPLPQEAASARASTHPLGDYPGLPARAAMAPVLDCANLPQEDLLAVKGAPARIVSSELVTQENGEPFCHAKGIIAPQIQFELHLPTRSYTGRYLQGGCGGACGVIYSTVSPPCDTSLAFSGAFAVSFNNSGHVGPAMEDTLWAAYAPQLRVDYAYRASHVTAVVAKEILARYYGKRPDYSYFIGCSNGGREGMMEAQRYPEDFDGIVVAAPALWVTSLTTRIIRESQLARNARGELILDEASVELLHKAVIAACDGLDGLEDGQIDNPRRCKFDPHELVCPPGQSAGCISGEQADAMQRIYEGPLDDEGRRLYFAGEPYGSELLWGGDNSFTANGHVIAANQFKYMIYGGHTHQDFDWKGWKPEASDVTDMLETGGYYNANDPDLTAFRKAGGKLIMWQGEADNAAGSYVLLDYYQRVRDLLGGFAGTDPFMRVYMVPGVYHCAGGYIDYQFSMLGSIVAWVERGEAPERIETTATLVDGTVRNRPLFPYPVQARYKGSGDINDASSFMPVRPQAEPDDRFDWVGAGLISGSPPIR